MNKTSHLFPPVNPYVECEEGYLCGSGQCLEWKQLCDNKTHCADGSDENGLCGMWDNVVFGLEFCEFLCMRKLNVL